MYLLLKVFFEVFLPAKERTGNIECCKPDCFESLMLGDYFVFSFCFSFQKLKYLSYAPSEMLLLVRNVQKDFITVQKNGIAS